MKDRKIWTPAEIEWCRVNHAKGIAAMAAHFGVSEEAMKGRYHTWRRAGKVPHIRRKEVGEITTIKSGGRVVRKQKTADGWKYLGPATQPAVENRSVTNKAFKAKKERDKVLRQAKQKATSKARQAAGNRQKTVHKLPNREQGPLVSLKVNSKTTIMCRPEELEMKKRKYGIAS